MLKRFIPYSKSVFSPTIQSIEECPSWWRPTAALIIGLSIAFTWSMPLRAVFFPDLHLWERMPIRYMPHGHCYFWEKGVLWPMVIGDIAVATAYYCIPFGLVLMGRWLPPLVRGFAWWFAAFIICCGNTHIASAVTIWSPYYTTQSLVVLITGFVSLLTLILGIRYYPVIVAECRRILDFVLEVSRTAQAARKAITRQ